MKVYKITKALAGLLALLGMFLIFGSVGTLDRCTEMGMVYPISEVIKHGMLGATLCIPITIIALFERE